MLPLTRASGLALLFIGLLACAPFEDQGRPAENLAREAIPPSGGTEAEVRVVVVLGDSLAAGLGLGEGEAFPALLEHHLVEEGFSVRVVNAGVSGDTTAGGAARLPWLLRQEPELVVVELGANDGLRGLAVETTEANLRRIIVQIKEAGASPLLVGMRLPPNYGDEYVREFEAIFPRLARELDVPLVPFLLSGVAARPDLNQADGIHPNAAGQKRVAENVLPYLRDLVQAGPDESGS